MTYKGDSYETNTSHGRNAGFVYISAYGTSSTDIITLYTSHSSAIVAFHSLQSQKKDGETSFIYKAKDAKAFCK